MTTRVAIAGATGRMGRMLLAALAETDLILSAALARPGDPLLGTDAGTVAGLAPLGIALTDKLADVLNEVDVLVDFSLPEATLAHAAVCADRGVAMVVGTTGFDGEQRAQLDALGDRMGLCIASNFSTGVNLLFDLLARAASVLGDDADIDITEAHHRHKVDAPSGTALSMGEVVANALGRDLAKVAVYGREGQTGPRAHDTIGFTTIRAGDIVGDHTVLFAADGERIELTHRASSRMAFARGALRAAAWMAGRAPGHYDMQDVLELRESNS